MQAPLIAIVGDANKSGNPVLAKKAAEDLGAELARKGCRILVFSGDPDFIEYDVVRGYLRDDVKRPPKAIRVRYPPQMHLLSLVKRTTTQGSIVNLRVLNGKSPFIRA